jgi:hypothetical protein
VQGESVKQAWVLGALVIVVLFFSARTLLVLAVLFHLLLLLGLAAVAFNRAAPTTTAEDQLARTVEEQEARIITLQRTVEDLRRQSAPPSRVRRVRDDDVTIPGHRPAY